MQRLLDASVEAVPTKPRPVNFGRIGGRWETLRRSGNAEPFPAGEDYVRMGSSWFLRSVSEALSS